MTSSNNSYILVNKNESIEEEFLSLDPIISKSIKRPKFGQRHIQVILAFFVVFINYIQRISMSVIIVAMTDPNATINENIPTYNWTEKSIILSSFMWGYMVPQIGAGYLATVFGAKWFLVGTLMGSSVSGLFIPLVAVLIGSKGVMGLRILQGISQSFMFPSIHAFLGKWVPMQERSRLGSLTYLGATMGNIVSMFLTGVIASSWYGWPAALYVYSAFGIAVGIIFVFFGVSEPDQLSSITEEKSFYIKQNLSEAGNESKTIISIPWFKLFSSLPVWALVMAQIGYSWSNFTLIFETPIYMNHVMKFNLKSNCVLSSLPYIAEGVCTLFYSFLADLLIEKKICSVSITRKLMNSCGILLPAIFMFLLAHCNSDDAHKAIIYLVLIGIAGGATRSGYNVNHIDLSPKFAGILMGMSNGLNAAVCSLAPLVVQIVVNNENNHNEWKIVFYIASCISVLCLGFNLVFGSGSAQSWNKSTRIITEQY